MSKTSIDRILRILDQVLNLLSKFTVIIAGICCAAATLLVVFEVVNRYGQLSNITIANELTGYLFASIIVFASASSFRHGIFPRLTFVVKRFPKKLRETLLTPVTYVAGFFCNSVFMWLVWNLFHESLRLHAVSGTWLYTPVAIPQIAMFTGFALFEIVLFGLIIKSTLELIAKRLQYQN